MVRSVFSIFLISFHPARDSRRLSHANISRSIVSAQRQFLCFSNPPPLVYSRTHFSSSSIEIYTLSPLLSLLSFRFSNILIMEIVNPTGSMMFLPIFSKYIWCFWKKRIYKMYRIFELLNLFAVYFFLSSITKVETILFDKIFFTFTISLFEGSLSPRFLHYFKFTLQSWIYGINSTSRNLNLKSPESTATSLLRFSNICWCAFLADTISMKNIFNKRGQ